MSSESDWTVVTSQDKKRVMKTGRKRRPKQPSKHASVTHGPPIDGLSDIEQILKMISTCKDYLLRTQFYKNFCEIWKSNALLSDTNDVVPQIVCYGIGNFSANTHSAPMWQLAGVLCMTKFLNDQKSRGGKIPVEYFDPCITPVEADVLAKLDIKLLSVNEQGKRFVDKTPTLFYMPHCPAALYENVLWANWDILTSTPVIIFGNSLRAYADLQKLRRQQQQQKCSLESVMTCIPWLEEHVVPYSKDDILDSPGNFENAFNDCYLSFVDAGRINTDKDSWPDRPAELIISSDSEVV